MIVSLVGPQQNISPTFCFRNVGSLIAAITALVSAIVMIQTGHDTLYARSEILSESSSTQKVVGAKNNVPVIMC